MSKIKLIFMLAQYFLAEHWPRILRVALFCFLYALAMVAVLFLPPIAQADECNQLATTYKKDRFSLSIGQLDALRLCVVEQMAQMINEPKQAEIDRAIGNNFGRREVTP